MNKYILLLMIGLTTAVSQADAQDRYPVELRPFQLTIGLLEPSVIAEVKLTDQISFAATGALSLGFASDELFIFPLARGSVRNYYPRKRVKKSNLRPNSGNFIALQGGYYFPAIYDGLTSADKSFFIGPAWGIQRNYASGIHLGLSLGLGYGNGPYRDGGIAGTGHFTFGFTL